MTITIDKAIRNLKAGRKDCGMIPEEEYTPTVDLAIEALKREKARRDFYGHSVSTLLPGEAEE